MLYTVRSGGETKSKQSTLSKVQIAQKDRTELYIQPPSPPS